MAEASCPPSSPRLTPKRKRDDLIVEQSISASPPRNFTHLTKPIFSFQPPGLLDQYRGVPDDGSSSPRSKVAQRFKDLAIVEEDEEGESGGGVTTSATNVNKNNHELHEVKSTRFQPEPAIFSFDGINQSGENTIDNPMDFSSGDMQIDDEDDGATRKRIKSFEEPRDLGIKPDLSIGPNGEDSANAADLVHVNDFGHVTLQTAVDPTLVKISKNGGNGRLQKSYPSINRLQDSKSRSRKRASTPSVSKRKTPESKPEDEPEVIDPIRAALTWQEDEITVYDPEDKDDDRRGMDGIGFRPSPAIAYQRDQMRRRQLAEYRRREENDARARRNQRRREQLGGGAEMERNHSVVRVRFSDAEPATVVTT